MITQTQHGRYYFKIDDEDVSRLVRYCRVDLDTECAWNWSVVQSVWANGSMDLEFFRGVLKCVEAYQKAQREKHANATV